jgi:hypothetical protein
MTDVSPSALLYSLSPSLVVLLPGPGRRSLLEQSEYWYRAPRSISSNGQRSIHLDGRRRSSELWRAAAARSPVRLHHSVRQSRAVSCGLSSDPVILRELGL